MKLKVLNLYAGIGGNRKLWENVDVTAIENNPEIANIYQDLYPNDEVLTCDAHTYLLNHHHEYDFIWSSPPCTTHSRIRAGGVLAGINRVCYVDMSLYQQILLLKHFSKCKWIIENVVPYYQSLINPNLKIGRHCFWSSEYVLTYDIKSKYNIGKCNINEMQEKLSINLDKYNITDKRKLLRNCVDPEIGNYIFNRILGVNYE